MEGTSEMAASELRFEMRTVAAKAYGLRDNYCGERSDEIVDAILAMPEMQAIRAWMNWAFEATVDVDDATNDAEPPLPDSVIAWMDSPS